MKGVGGGGGSTPFWWGFGGEKRGGESHGAAPGVETAWE